MRKTVDKKYVDEKMREMTNTSVNIKIKFPSNKMADSKPLHLLSVIQLCGGPVYEYKEIIKFNFIQFKSKIFIARFFSSSLINK